MLVCGYVCVQFHVSVRVYKDVHVHMCVSHTLKGRTLIVHPTTDLQL